MLNLKMAAFAAAGVAALSLGSGIAFADVESDLDAAVAQWNMLYGSEVIALGWTEIDDIDTDDEVIQTIDWMTDPVNAYVPVGDPFDPTTMTAVPLGSAGPEVLAAWSDTVTSLVELGQRRFQIEWQFVDSGDAFTSITVADGDTIVLDPMWSNVVVAEVLETASGGVDILWIWGSVRGEIRWSVTCRPDGSGGILCDHDCSAWMTLGDAQIQCSVTRQGNCCILNYGWAWRTPTGSIRIVWNPRTGKFEVTVTGLGSSGKGNGSISDCCPTVKCTVNTTDATAGRFNDFVVSGMTPGSEITFVYGYQAGRSDVFKCAADLSIEDAKVMGHAVAGADGRAVLKVMVPDKLRGQALLMQAVDPTNCCVAPVTEVDIH